MRRCDIAVLTNQARSIRQYRFYPPIMRLVRSYLPRERRDPDPEAVGGHYGVTRSLIRGLRLLGADFLYAPKLERTSARVAAVLSGADKLREAIEWKRRGGCELLLAGPNVADGPDQHGGLMLSPEIDRAILASDKMREIFERREPKFANRISVWPAGVDDDYWKPSGRGTRDTILIYEKRMPALGRELLAKLQERAKRVEILHYGEKRRDKYKLYEFRNALDRASCCVMLTLDEPQGLAASEAWSMNVPTFAFRAEKVKDHDTIPYLTPATGQYWSSFEELLVLLGGLSKAQYRPREWVLQHMTDEICARKLLEIADDVYSRRTGGKVRV